LYCEALVYIRCGPTGRPQYHSEFVYSAGLYVMYYVLDVGKLSRIIANCGVFGFRPNIIAWSSDLKQYPLTLTYVLPP
jgi:hypothetical protein